MYADSVWAVKVVNLFGGPEHAAIIHRIAAVAFLTAVIGHIVALFYKLIIHRKGSFEWFGPDSLLPRRKDVTDMRDQFRWFFGKGPQPRFDRWTYWEKFDYWAVYWGALVIGVSGLLLWFSEFFSRYLPGWVFNIATVAHGVEAFLAVTTLFVVHFFNNHFRPGKFPLDTVMFIGSWSLAELQEERPANYDRLVQAGTLEQHLVPPPSKRANLISHILGFTLIGFGLLLLLLVVIGFVQKGLV
jgi:thiosulfate reductase cytochrome b subunit